MENFGEYLNIGSMVIALASAVANITPTDKDNQIIGKIAKVINFFALNWRR